MLKLLFPLLLFLPAPVLAHHDEVSMCVRTKRTVIAGHYDRYGRWHSPYTMEEDVVEPCEIYGYVPPVGRPAPPRVYRRYPREIVCSTSSLTVLGIPIIGSRTDCP